MAEVNKFDVLKEMGLRDLDIRGFSLDDNLISMNLYKEHGTITLSVNKETVLDLWANKPLIAALIVADAEQFNEIKKELESVQEQARIQEVP